MTKDLGKINAVQRLINSLADLSNRYREVKKLTGRTNAELESLTEFCNTLKNDLEILKTS